MTNSTSSSSTLPAQISAHLATTLSVTPSSTWLAGFLSTQKPTTPLSSLLATARHRLLHSDIIASLAPAASTTFPVDVHDAERRERRLPGPLAVQVLVADNLSQSRWTQIEALEARERGEGTRGREVVRAVPAAEDGEPDPVGAGGEGGTCRLLLQDAKGVKVWGLELKSVQGVKVGMGIGSKVGISCLFLGAAEKGLQGEMLTLALKDGATRCDGRERRVASGAALDDAARRQGRELAQGLG